MGNISKKRDTCRLCQSDSLELVFPLAPTPIGDWYVTKDLLDQKQELYDLDVFLCENCGLLQIVDIIEPDEIYRKYIYHTSDSLGLVKHFKMYSEDVLGRLNPEDGSFFVDIGSNDGSLLNFFKEKRMKVLGVDPAPEVAKTANDRGIKTINDYFGKELAKKIKDEHGEAKIITANNVFANIDDLDSFTEGIIHLLAPDGFFIVESGYALDLLKKKVFDNIHHEHLSFFCATSLSKFFDKFDLEIIDVQRVPTKAGSIRCIMQRKGGPMQKSSNVEETLALEKQEKIHNPETYKQMYSELQRIKKKLITLLKKLKSEGKKIAGYGAAIGVTVVLYEFGIDQDLLDFLVDDNPNRQGLYSPGMHLPVLNPRELYNRHIDYVVILAWQYADPIILKHKKFLNKGGKFITFLPKLEIR